MWNPSKWSLEDNCNRYIFPLMKFKMKEIDHAKRGEYACKSGIRREINLTEVYRVSDRLNGVGQTLEE